MAKDPYRYFRIEARELVVGLHQGVLELEKGAPAKEATAGLLRLAHTLKGAARVVKLVGVAELAHAIEDALAPFREGQRAVPHETVRLRSSRANPCRAIARPPRDRLSSGTAPRR